MATPEQKAVIAHARSHWTNWWCDGSQKPFWLDKDLPPEVVALLDRAGVGKRQTILDVGCGDGRIACALSSHGYSVIGIDVAETAIQQARMRCARMQAGPDFRTIDICADHGAIPCVDVILDRGCLHGMADAVLPAYFHGAARALAKGGLLLMLHKLADHDAGDGSDIAVKLLAASDRTFSLVSDKRTGITGRDMSVPAQELIFRRSNDQTKQ